MSALGHKQTCAVQTRMSAMGQKRTFHSTTSCPSTVGGLPAHLLAHVSRIESRMALRGNHTLGSSQASENIALARRDGLAMLQCISLTTAHNIVRKSNT